MKLKKILLWLLGGFLLLAIAIILLGLLSSPKYENSMTNEYYYSPGMIFNALTEPEMIKVRRPEISEIEILEENQFGPVKWKEHAKMGGYTLIEVTELVPNTTLTLNMPKSSFGLEGSWTYDIELLSDNCLVTIKENSECKNLFTRAMLIIGGRDATLKREHNNLLLTLQKNYDQL